MCVHNKIYNNSPSHRSMSDFICLFVTWRKNIFAKYVGWYRLYVCYLAKKHFRQVCRLVSFVCLLLGENKFSPSMLMCIVCLFVCLFVCLYVCLFVRVAVCSPIYDHNFYSIIIKFLAHLCGH